jgi:hypothetical protein
MAPFIAKAKTLINAPIDLVWSINLDLAAYAIALQNRAQAFSKVGNSEIELEKHCSCNVNQQRGYWVVVLGTGFFFLAAK